MTDQIERIEQIIGRELGEPTRAMGEWLVWDQPASRGLTLDFVARLKAAGMPAFFRSSERKFGVKKEA